MDIVDGAGAGGVGAPRGSLCFEPVVVLVVVVVVVVLLLLLLMLQF